MRKNHARARRFVVVLPQSFTDPTRWREVLDEEIFMLSHGKDVYPKLSMNNSSRLVDMPDITPRSDYSREISLFPKSSDPYDNYYEKTLRSIQRIKRTYVLPLIKETPEMTKQQECGTLEKHDEINDLSFFLREINEDDDLCAFK